MFGNVAARQVWRAIVCGLLGAAMSSASAKDEFPVSTAQMQALGITLQKLGRPAPI